MTRIFLYPMTVVWYIKTMEGSADYENLSDWADKQIAARDEKIQELREALAACFGRLDTVHKLELADYLKLLEER